MRKFIGFYFLCILPWYPITSQGAELSESVELILGADTDYLFPETPEGGASLATDARKLLDSLLLTIEEGGASPFEQDLAAALESARQRLALDKFGAAFFLTEIRSAMLLKASRQLANDQLDPQLTRLLDLYAVSTYDIKSLLPTKDNTEPPKNIDEAFRTAFRAFGASPSNESPAVLMMLQQPSLLRMPGDEILLHKEKKALLLRWIVFERYRRLEIPLIVEYVKRGGRSSELSLEDVSTLYRIIPKEEVRRKSYPLLNIGNASAGSLMNFLKLGEKPIPKEINKKTTGSTAL